MTSSRRRHHAQNPNIALALELLRDAASKDPSLSLRISIVRGDAVAYDHKGHEPTQLSLRFTEGEAAAVESVRAIFRRGQSISPQTKVNSPGQQGQQPSPQPPKSSSSCTDAQLPLPVIELLPSDPAGHAVSEISESIDGVVVAIDLLKRTLTVIKNGDKSYPITLVVKDGFDFDNLGLVSHLSARYKSSGTKRVYAAERVAARNYWSGWPILLKSFMG